MTQTVKTILGKAKAQINNSYPKDEVQILTSKWITDLYDLSDVPLLQQELDLLAYEVLEGRFD